MGGVDGRHREPSSTPSGPSEQSILSTARWGPHRQSSTPWPHPERVVIAGAVQYHCPLSWSLMTIRSASHPRRSISSSTSSGRTGARRTSSRLRVSRCGRPDSPSKPLLGSSGRRSPRESVAAQYDYLLRNLDVRPVLPLIRVPTLVLSSDNPSFLPIAHGPLCRRAH